MNYFDYTATTPVDKEVLETYIRVTNDFFANSTALHKLGQQSYHMIEVCSNTMCDLLNVKNDEVIYTANATEANNIAIMGWCNKYLSQETKPKIITTKMEHVSVFNTFKHLENDFDVVYLNVNEEGQIDYEELEKEMTKNVILVSIMWVNNIIGTVQDIKRVIEIVKKYPKAKLHVDCVQGICKVKPNFDFNDIDMFTISCHKIYGPKGIAALFVKNNMDLNPILYGSSNQYSLKPGTMDVALVASFTKALKKFLPLTEKHQGEVTEKFNYLKENLKNNQSIIFNTPDTNISHYILNCSLPGIKGETLVHKLEEKDIYISTGSACSSKLAKPEKTVYAMTNDLDRSTSVMRISLSQLTTKDELNKLIEELKDLKNVR